MIYKKVDLESVNAFCPSLNPFRQLMTANLRSLPFGVKCYFFSTDFLNWTNSRDRCVEKGGHLAIITSQAEQVSGGPHWFGLNDLETEGKWMWVNNQFWNKGKDGASQPNNRKDEDPSGENCASLGNENGDFTKWFDASCSKTRQYLCEM
uniref:C-type lectin domain-containing protein n=1 Tax=Astyanax mexicanus TaxID=7994 RepID=A0A8B9GTI7_ASTMX